MQKTDFQGQSEKTQNPKNFNNIHNLFELPKKYFDFLYCMKALPKESVLKKKNRTAYKAKQFYYQSCQASGHEKRSNKL